MCRENARQLWFLDKNGEYFYVRGSSALSVSIWEVSEQHQLRCSEAVSFGQTSALQRLPTVAPGRVRLPSPVSGSLSASLRSLRAQGLDLQSWQVQTLRPTRFKRQKCHSSKWTNGLRSCAPENPVSRHLLGHRYFLPFSVLRYRLRSPPTSACATVRV